MRLSITTDATEVLLNPGRRNTDTVPLLVQVHVELGAKERWPHHLTWLGVTLQRNETMMLDKRLESNTFEPLSVSFDVSGQTLLPGVKHTWEARIDISPSSPPYFYRPSEAGPSTRAWQSLVAVARYSGRFGIQRSKTTCKDLYFVHQPAFGTADADPYCYTHTQTGANEGIGPVLVGARSQHLTIGGTMRIQAQLPAPADSFRLRSIEFAIQETVTLRSRQVKGLQHVLPTTRTVLHYEKTNTLQPEGWLLRLPTCSSLRASSVDDRRGIHVEHLLSARFCYTVVQDGSDKSKPYAYTLAWSIHIPSCSLRWESVTLPPYSRADPSPVPDADRSEVACKDERRRRCVCGKDRQELLAIDEFMARIHGLPFDNAIQMESLETQLADKLSSDYDEDNLNSDGDSFISSSRARRRRLVKSMISVWSVDDIDDASSHGQSTSRASGSTCSSTDLTGDSRTAPPPSS